MRPVKFENDLIRKVIVPFSLQEKSSCQPAHAEKRIHKKNSNNTLMESFKIILPHNY